MMVEEAAAEPKTSEQDIRREVALFRLALRSQPGTERLRHLADTVNAWFRQIPRPNGDEKDATVQFRGGYYELVSFGRWWSHYDRVVSTEDKLDDSELATIEREDGRFYWPRKNSEKEKA